MNCPLPELCSQIDRFLKSGEKELPPYLHRNIEIITESPDLLAHARMCLLINAHFCHLMEKYSEYGRDPKLDELLKLLAP